MNPAIRFLVRVRLKASSRRGIGAGIRGWEARYLELAGRLSPEQGEEPVLVPAMPGVDPEMREWSYFQLLEHNAIVNRSMTELVEDLALDREPRRSEVKDFKSDVLPGGASGAEQVEAFRNSVRDHLRRVAVLPRLRGSRTFEHPLFGGFDAHMWHGMFGLHLMTHFRQAQAIVEGARQLRV